MICEQCGIEHDGTYGSGRFCCRSCSNKWVALHQSEEAKSIKIAKGAHNLLEHKGWKLSKEKNIEVAKKGAEARAVTMKSRRRDWLTSVFEGKEDPYKGGYTKFKNILIEFGFKTSVCENCNLSEWMGKDIPLELHHIDGDHSNNKLSN